MIIEVRLRKVLQDHNLDEHGVTQHMARDLKIHRHTVANLLGNKANPSLKVLGLVCTWLQEHGVPGRELPHALIGSRPSGLWQAVVAPGTVRIYVGAYEQMEGGEPAMVWVSRRDATVQSELVRLLSTPTEGIEHQPAVIPAYVPFRFSAFEAQMSDEWLTQNKTRSAAVYRQMREQAGTSAAILIGSQRVNYLVEHVVANLFGCEPFVPIGQSPRVPFHLVYRGKSGATPSCFGGLDVPPGYRGARQPGVYYLDKAGRWVCCPWARNGADAGLVVIAYDPGSKAIEVIVLGFSGRGTEALGRLLVSEPDRFWPPDTAAKDRRVGVYVCRFEISQEGRPNAPEVVSARNVQVVPIGSRILAKYLA